MENTSLDMLLLLSAFFICGHTQALPVATLRISLQGPLYSGETVTLQCDIPDYTGWTYLWSRDNQQFSSQSSETINIFLPDQAGQYQCQGTRRDRPQQSQLSGTVLVRFTALPLATVSISPQGLLYSGETVSMRCDISMYTDWMYSWFIGNNINSRMPGKTITALSNHAGQYRCVGVRTGRPQWSQPSVFLPIRVTGEFTIDAPSLTCCCCRSVSGHRIFPLNPIAIPTDYQPSTTLTSDKEDVFTGDRVTLTCNVESSGWTFYWYRHRPDSTPVTTTSGYSYTLSWVSVSDGQYWCRAGRGDPVYYTLYSDPVQLHVTGESEIVL
uniref:Ig-like domain-containing protein n=1 Tax=Hucho hucho TaxID=62062 RepID=A0A4W5K9Z3_9TELE